jgi:hypothetical protein
LEPIINEVGTRDIWPAMAESVTTGYGSAGTYGFNRPLVRDRWHNGAAHGFFLDANFCRKFWVPYLSDGKIVAGAFAPERPRLWIRLLSVFKAKYVLAAAILTFLAFQFATDRIRISNWFANHQEHTATHVDVVSVLPDIVAAATSDWKTVVERDQEVIRTLQRQNDLNEAQIRQFFILIGRDPGSPDQMMLKLTSLALELKRAKEVVSGVEVISSAADNPAIMKTTKEAKNALETGDLDRARQALSEVIWRWSPGQAEVIPVCWENVGSEFMAERDLVRSAQRETWEAASKIRFVGWGTCSKDSRGVRIRVDDVGPYTKELGPKLDGMKDGVVLNFTFENWSQRCRSDEQQKALCIQGISVHMFGHVLGFAHTQNRPDAPGECAALRQGSDVPSVVVPYHPHSVMNYCNPVYNNNGILSELDKKAVALLYGPPE